jgi:membrane protease YdiL (CAAX protease family)
LKDAVRLIAYLAAVVLIGALIAPLLFWSGQWLVAHRLFEFLARFDFETFFHRALLIAAALLLWPLFRTSNVRKLADLDLAPNKRPVRHVVMGLLFATVPLLCCAAVLLALRFYSVRHGFPWHALGKTVRAATFVPFIEEPLFRGLILGLLLRNGWRGLSILITSALFAAVHFFKSLGHVSTIVTWSSGFQAVAESFSRFADPVSILPAFATLFLIGLIMADARVRTRSLWLPIGLHAGWILARGAFPAFARPQVDISPWVSKDLLVGIVPIAIGLLTWMLMILCLKSTKGRIRHGEHDRFQKA